MKTLFDSIDLGRLPVKNRIVRSATYEYLPAELPGEGEETLIARYGALAAGGVGAIITGMMGINGDSHVVPMMSKPYCYGHEDPSFDAAFANIMNAVHAHGSKLVVQINHCGIKLGPYDYGSIPLGPSDLELVPGRPGRAMSDYEIDQTVRDFAEAALQSKSSGADGVQLHAAHGYLLSQFLSPHFNKRTDQYGGPIENRARFLLRVATRVRATLGANFPLWVKINATDLEDESITLEECIWVCKALEEIGIDAIEVTGGLGNGKRSSPSRIVKSEADEGSFTAQAEAVAKAVSIPVISVGGYRSPQVLERVLNESDIAAISMARPLLSEPGLVARWQKGDIAPARCISCNRCFGQPLTCKAFAD